MDRLRLIDDEIRIPDYEGEVSVMVVRKRGSKPARVFFCFSSYLTILGRVTK